MILVCGIPSEPPVRLVLQAARRLRVPVLLFNQREAADTEIMIEIQDGRLEGEISIRGMTWSLSEVRGAYNRLMDLHNLPEHRGRHPDMVERMQKSILVHEALTDWLEGTTCRVMNRGSAMLSNQSKPYQAQLIEKTGFPTPPTLITNDPDEVRAFAAMHGAVIYKSTSSVRSIVKMLDQHAMEHLDRVRHLPTQFQAYVAGVNIRVHVVGKRVFATQVATEAVDYRYAGQDSLPLSMTEIQLPEQNEEKCLRLSDTLQLPLCGIDLKKSPEGEYYCFEVNPSPGYSYYQNQTGQDIAEGIVGYLAGKTD